ncbi:MAG: ABC transporter ATP-binding protein [Candidatus Izemoplasmatales bacterium]|nr:ABC transporter ATP-binding protein [Candidatus Izemoplasmatales bacterium]
MSTYAFAVKDLRYRYPKGQFDVINGISFNVPEGTIFGLLGPSGAGKSTTQKIMIKLLDGYSGTISYFGKELSSFTKSFYEEIGVGFEMPVHFNKLTGKENLDYFARLYQKNVDYEAMMTRLGLFEARNRAVGEYSKGMKVRLNFIRAMLNDPRVIFLDEPTAGLDPKNAKIVKDMIQEAKTAGKTVFITTHLMGDVEQLCDHVVFMNKGLITETASVRDLKMKYGKKEVRVEYYAQDELRHDVFPLDHLGNDEAFLDTITHHRLETIHSGETSLEDIFILVTGETRNE